MIKKCFIAFTSTDKTTFIFKLFLCCYNETNFKFNIQIQINALLESHNKGIFMCLVETLQAKKYYI
jgi:hypothetical protein